MSGSEIYAVVGLGNPGARYADTRHNVGHMVIDALAEQLRVSLSAHRQTQSLHVLTRLGVGGLAPQVILGKSQGYMNASGGPVNLLLRYYHVPPENLIVIHDDLDLPFGELKLKRSGGEGGHNGLKSISSVLGTQDYIRMRVGIDRPPGRMDPADYVLSRFTSAQRAELSHISAQSAEAVMDVIDSGLEAATMRLHTAQRAARTKK